MEPQFELQRLLRRHREIRHAMRQPGGVRVTVERELYAIAERLKDFPAAQRVLQADAVNTILRR
jgi:hypothetical protein